MPASDRPNRDIKQRSQKRTPLGVARQKLVLNSLDDPKHHYHWINDTGTRVQEALDGGYEFVSAEQAGEVGVRDVLDTNTDLGTGVSKVVSRETGRRAFLMRIPMDIYLHDQQTKQVQVDKIDQAIRGGDIKGLEGRTRVNPEHKLSVKESG